MQLSEKGLDSTPRTTKREEEGREGGKVGGREGEMPGSCPRRFSPQVSLVKDMQMPRPKPKDGKRKKMTMKVYVEFMLSEYNSSAERRKGEENNLHYLSYFEDLSSLTGFSLPLSSPFYLPLSPSSLSHYFAKLYISVRKMLCHP